MAEYLGKHVGERGLREHIFEQTAFTFLAQATAAAQTTAPGTSAIGDCPTDYRRRRRPKLTDRPKVEECCDRAERSAAEEKTMEYIHGRAKTEVQKMWDR